MIKKLLAVFFVIALLPFILGSIYKLNTPVPIISNVRINEVELNPAGSPDLEWVELYNLGPDPVNLSEWYITDRDNNSFFFPNVIIDPNGFYVLEGLTNDLVNNNENITLYDSFGTVQDNSGILSDPYDDQRTWQRVPDGTGSFVFENSTKGVTNAVVPIPPINITITSRNVDPLCAFVNDKITLKAKVEGTCPEEVKFGVNVDGSWTNFTAIEIAGNYTATIPSGTFKNSGNVDWKVFVKDCYNRIQEDGIQTFTLHGKTSLSVNPPAPNGLNGWYVSEPEFTLTNLTNPEATKLWYQWNSDKIILYSGTFGLEDIPNAVNGSFQVAGILNLNWFSNACASQLGKNESKQTQTIKVDLTSPVIKDISPDDGSKISNPRPEIKAYLDEVYNGNSGIDKDKVKLEVDGADVTNNTTIHGVGMDAQIDFVPSGDLFMGTHNVKLTAFDKAGRITIKSWSFEILTKPVFVLNVYSPENKIYNSKRVLFNVTTTLANTTNLTKVAKIDYIDYNDKKPKWKSLCLNCNKYSNSNTLLEGNNNITIRATDIYGQEALKNIILFIDSIKPTISATLPVSNKVINGDFFYIKYSDDNLRNITLFWDGSSQVLSNCSAGKNQECTTSVDLSAYDGQQIQYWFEISDDINKVQSKKTKVTVDTTSPHLIVNYPKDGNNYGRKVPFVIRVSEKVNLEYLDLAEANPSWKRLCTNCNEFGVAKPATQSFSRGNHKILIRASDKAGNRDEKTINFFVDY